MISTGMAGHAIPVVLAEQGEQDLGEDVGLDRAAHGADALARPDHGRIVHVARPAIFRAKYALMVADRFAGPPS